METKRLFDFLTEKVEKSPNKPFLSAKVNKQWQHYTYADTQQKANEVSQLLLNLGLGKDDKIAIIANNRPEWNFVDIGAQQIGIVLVPMYPTISQADYEFIFKDAGIKYAFVGDANIYKKVKPLLGVAPTLQGIYTFDKIEGTKHFWKELPKQIDTDKIAQLKAVISEEDLATIIYTSGTTGNPKGVMLSHRNISSNIHSIQQITPFMTNEKALSFLPLCHSFERMVFFSYLGIGLHIYYAESIETIAENLKEVQPFCFTTVPRLLEKVYERIMARGHALTGFKRKLFFWSIDLGLRYELGIKRNLWYNLQLFLARKLVFTKWHEALGGNVHFIVTGAAPIQPRLVKLFSAAGIVLLEGYGLTETSPVLCANRPHESERVIGTVGLPVPNVEIKFAEDGEILAKGPNIMMGYYNRPDLTAEVIDKDGWFHTGDIGELQDGKFLKITDRKKELFKTSGGKYVAPQAIENKMKECRFIEQMMVVGDSRKYVAALIVLSLPDIKDWAKENNVDLSNGIIDNKQVIALIDIEISKRNADFGKWEQIKRYTLLQEEWTSETGELTPTMKLKRKAINERYKDLIEAMYQNEEAAHV